MNSIIAQEGRDRGSAPSIPPSCEARSAGRRARTSPCSTVRCRSCSPACRQPSDRTHRRPRSPSRAVARVPLDRRESLGDGQCAFLVPGGRVQRDRRVHGGPWRPGLEDVRVGAALRLDARRVPGEPARPTWSAITDRTSVTISLLAGTSSGST